MLESKERSSVRRFFVPSLIIAFFATAVIESITGVFLADIATAFFGSTDSIAIASASQLVTLSSIASIAFAVILGILSVKFNHKKLLMFGSLAVALGILGCFLAPNFLFLQIFYPLEGIGTVAVNAMAFALIGEFLVLSKRPKVIGLVLAGGSLTAVVGAIMINLFFSGSDGWRAYLLWYALPIAIISLAAVYFGVPSASKSAKDRVYYLESFKQIFLRKSAASCLIGIMFRQANFVWVLVFSLTFFRVQFGLSLASTALVALGGASIFLLSEIVGGVTVNRVGRKRQAVVTLVLSAPGLMALAFISNLWIVLPLFWAGGFIYGLSFPATTSLILEQAPEARGTMMSMSSIFVTCGVGLGAALGGIALVLSGWVGLIATFAILQLIAGAVFFFLTKDPCKM